MINIKSHKKTGFLLLSRKYSFGKTLEGVGVKLTPSLFRINLVSSNLVEIERKNSLFIVFEQLSYDEVLAPTFSLLLA